MTDFSVISKPRQRAQGGRLEMLSLPWHLTPPPMYWRSMFALLLFCIALWSFDLEYCPLSPNVSFYQEMHFHRKTQQTISNHLHLTESHALTQFFHTPNRVGVQYNKKESIVNSSSFPVARKRNIPLTLIVSMMRSGSTFTGDVFRSHPNSFYLFEPMQYLTQSVGRNEIVFVNGTVRSYNESQLHDIHAEMIINLLLCRFEDVPFQVFKTSHFLYHNRLKQHYSCAQRTKDSVTAMRKQCIPNLTKRCKKANSFTMKLITVRMKAISRVMQLLPEVHVIQLVRDPRPVLLSQINVGQINKTKIENESISHCEILKNDIKETESDIYRNNFHRQRYEDLAYDPIGQFQGLFEFSGLEFNDAVLSRIRKIAMRTGKVKKCQYCSDKGDAMEASVQWRISANYSIVHAIQEQCLNIIDSLEYVAVDSAKDLHDKKISLTKW